MARIIEFERVKNLDKFVNTFKDDTYSVVYGPHVVLEDHSEISIFKVQRGEEIVAYIVAHYITQYYRAIISGEYIDDEEYLRRLLEIKYSGQRWSIPVNPVYLVLYDESLLDRIKSYEDEYPVPDGERIVEEYRARNPGYRNLPRIVLARLIE